RGLHALSDLGILRDDRDAAVARDLDEGVRREIVSGELRALRVARAIGERGADEQAATGDAGDAEESAAVEELVHLASCAAISAARWMPSRMRWYVAQRQRLPFIVRSMSASPGRGVRRSIAAAVIIWPAWQ